MREENIYELEHAIMKSVFKNELERACKICKISLPDVEFIIDNTKLKWSDSYMETYTACAIWPKIFVFAKEDLILMPSGLQNTIRHEIAHVLELIFRKNIKHDKKWLDTAAKIGYNGEKHIERDLS